MDLSVPVWPIRHANTQAPLRSPLCKCSRLVLYMVVHDDRVHFHDHPFQLQLDCCEKTKNKIDMSAGLAYCCLYLSLSDVCRMRSYIRQQSFYYKIYRTMFALGEWNAQYWPLITCDTSDWKKQCSSRNRFHKEILPFSLGGTRLRWIKKNELCFSSDVPIETWLFSAWHMGSQMSTNEKRRRRRKIGQMLSLQFNWENETFQPQNRIADLKVKIELLFRFTQDVDGKGLSKASIN